MTEEIWIDSDLPVVEQNRQVIQAALRRGWQDDEAANLVDMPADELEDGADNEMLLLLVYLDAHSYLQTLCEADCYMGWTFEGYGKLCRYDTTEEKR
jgi:hypothetical protein